VTIFLHNPQKINFWGKTVQDWVTGGKVASKLGYFRDIIKKYKIFIYCDNYGSSFPFNNFVKSRMFSSLVKYVEIYLWLIINNLNPFRVKVVFNRHRIRRSDILLSITHTYLDTRGEAANALLELDCKKLLYLSHYMFFPSVIAENIIRGDKSIKLFAENNLSKNSLFFKKYFPAYKEDVYTLPFLYQERFKKNVPFSSRNNKCLAIGSYQTIDIYASAFRNMYEYFKVDTFHPMRKSIYVNKDKIKRYIDCYISYINDDVRNVLSMVKSPSKNVFSKAYIKVHNYFIRNVMGSYTRRAYYNFDITRLYNQYKMIVVPEEVVDLPGISFVESMACGCAYFGIKSNMYKDIGLIDGVHYIAYDNNLDSLLDLIKYYQEHNDKLERIAENGYDFVTKNFSKNTVSERFVADLKNFQNALIKNENKADEIVFESSFWYR